MIILIPDAYIGDSSGAIVAQTITRLLLILGLKVVVFSQDVLDTVDVNGAILKRRLPYRAASNYFERKWRKEFYDVIKETNPFAVFWVGSITNKPLCYIEIAKSLSLRTVIMIFMQDFFCMKYYANDRNNVCVKCIDGDFRYALENKCVGHGLKSVLKWTNNVNVRKRLKSLLNSVDCVITSSDQQVEFYKHYGIMSDKCLKTPLFFDKSKLAYEERSKIGDYYICIAQNRVEKGFHFLPRILDHCDESVKIIAAYNGEQAVKTAIEDNGFIPYIEKGVLEVRNLTFRNGLKDMIRNSRGVIIPSIWPTTTEYGLLEALGLRKIVYVFDAGIHKEIFHNGVNGFISPVGDCKAFADNLMRKLSNDEIKRITFESYKLFEQLTDDRRWLQDLKTALDIK